MMSLGIIQTRCTNHHNTLRHHGNNFHYIHSLHLQGSLMCRFQNTCSNSSDSTRLGVFRCKNYMCLDRLCSHWGNLFRHNTRVGWSRRRMYIHSGIVYMCRSLNNTLHYSLCLVFHIQYTCPMMNSQNNFHLCHRCIYRYMFEFQRLQGMYRYRSQQNKKRYMIVSTLCC